MLEENAGTTLLVPTVVLVDDPGCFTVTDTFNGPEPSSFTVCDMNDPAYVAGMLEENAGTTLLVPTVVLVDDPGCFTVTDTFNGPEPSSFTVCDMNDPAYVAGMLEENAGTTLFVPTVVLVDDPGCFTVTDTYTCDVTAQDTGDCGSFTVCDTNDPVYVPAAANSAHMSVLAQDAPGCMTVVDTFSCNVDAQESGNCGGFTVCDTNNPLYQSGVLTALAPPAALPSLPKEGVKARPGLSHFILAGHACTLGAITATLSVVEGKQQGSWAELFKASATANAAAVTPLGAKLLEAHL